MRASIAAELRSLGREGAPPAHRSLPVFPLAETGGSRLPEPRTGIRCAPVSQRTGDCRRSLPEPAADGSPRCSVRSRNRQKCRRPTAGRATPRGSPRRRGDPTKPGAHEGVCLVAGSWFRASVFDPCPFPARRRQTGAPARCARPASGPLPRSPYTFYPYYDNSRCFATADSILDLVGAQHHVAGARVVQNQIGVLIIVAVDGEQIQYGHWPCPRSLPAVACPLAVNAGLLIGRLLPPASAHRLSVRRRTPKWRKSPASRNVKRNAPAGQKPAFYGTACTPSRSCLHKCAL